MPDDPKTKLTQWLTEGAEDPTEKSRIMSKEQAEFYHAYRFMAKVLKIPEYQEFVEIDEVIMEAYQGKRSEEVVSAMKSIGDATASDVGKQPLRRHLQAQGGSDGSG
jgi:hypothetical protein